MAGVEVGGVVGATVVGAVVDGGTVVDGSVVGALVVGTVVDVDDDVEVVAGDELVVGVDELISVEPPHAPRTTDAPTDATNARRRRAVPGVLTARTVVRWRRPPSSTILTAPLFRIW